MDDTNEIYEKCLSLRKKIQDNSKTQDVVFFQLPDIDKINFELLEK